MARHVCDKERRHKDDENPSSTNVHNKEYNKVEKEEGKCDKKRREDKF